RLGSRHGVGRARGGPCKGDDLIRLHQLSRHANGRGAWHVGGQGRAPTRGCTWTGGAAVLFVWLGHVPEASRAFSLHRARAVFCSGSGIDAPPRPPRRFRMDVQKRVHGSLYWPGGLALLTPLRLLEYACLSGSNSRSETSYPLFARRFGFFVWRASRSRTA